MKKIAILILLMFAIVATYSQSRVEISELGVFGGSNNGSGRVYLNQEKILNDIIIDKAKTEKRHRIWRVRIYIGSGQGARSSAESIRKAFVAKYPDIQADTRYPSPFFKVFVGQFTSRIDAESFRNKIKGEYPDSRVEYGVL